MADGAVDEDTHPSVDASSTDAASGGGSRRDATIPVVPAADASAPDPDAGDLTCPPPNDLLAGAACPDVASGVYAIKTVLDVWWNDDVYPPITDPGRGPITLIQKGTLTDLCSDGRIGRAELQLCGLALPPMVAWGACRAHQLEAPDSLWDEPGMPSVVTTGMADLDVGGVLSLYPLHGAV